MERSPSKSLWERRSCVMADEKFLVGDWGLGVGGWGLGVGGWGLKGGGLDSLNVWHRLAVSH